MQFYAGVPLNIEEQRVGTLCVIDSKPRQLSPNQIEALECLGRQVESLLKVSLYIKRGRDLKASHGRLSETAKSEQAKYKRLREFASDGIHILNQEGDVIECSQSFAELLGYTYEEAQNLNVEDWDAKFPRDELSNIIKDLIKNPRKFETKHQRKDGSIFDVQINAKGIDLNGELLLYASSRDISEQKKLEHDLVQAKNKSENALKAKSIFLANMSHEIRTPLNGILGLTNLIEHHSKDETVLDYASSIKDCGESLLVIINDILDISKVEAGKLDLESVPVDIMKLVKTTLTPFQQSLKERKIDLELIQIKPDPGYLLGDPVRLRQVLFNLIGNAVKFTSKGTVKIQVQFGEKKRGKTPVTFSVIDSGVGIPKNRIDSIFRPFEQVDAATTRKFGGTGLGLAICKKLVDMMGGKIQVESEEGKGSHFSFSVNLKEAKKDHNYQPQPSQTHSLPKDNNLSLLIAEDNEINRLIIEKLLLKMGVSQIDFAVNGQIACEMVEEKDYDLILMDVQMPILDGYEATKIIREFAPNTLPIVGLSANVFKEDKDHARQCGMSDYLEKPIKADQVARVLFEAYQNKTEKKAG